MIPCRGMSRWLRIATTAIWLGLCASPAQALLWPSEVSRVESALGSSDVQARRRAAARLPKMPSAVVRRLLARVLADDDVEVRLSAAAAVRALDLTDPRFPPLDWLTHRDARLRLAAAQGLSGGAPPDSLGPLTRALSDSEPQVRAAAARALGASGDAAAAPALLGRLDDTVPEVKRSVIRALARLSDPRAVVPLISRLEDAEGEVRRAVLMALGELGDGRAKSAVVLSLRDADEQVREAALTALAEIGDVEVVPSVASLLSDDPRGSVRRAAIDCLSRLGGPAAVAALVDALGAVNAETIALLDAFERLKMVAAPALLDCLQSGDGPSKLDGCALSLARTHAPEAVPAVLEASALGRVRPRVALQAFVEAPDARAIPFALEHLVNPDPLVRRAARSAGLVLLDPKHPDGRASQPIAQAFRRAGARSERLELVQLLGRTGSPKSQAVLEPIADHSDDLDFRIAALTALGNLRVSPAPGALLGALDDPEAGVRMAAALAIRESGPPELAEELIERLARADAQDRTALLLALGGALSRVTDPRVMARAEPALARSRDRDRDAFLEALATAQASSASEILARLVRGSGARASERAKLAEVLAARPEERALAAELARDADEAVRANAVWSLGSVGDKATRAFLVERLSDPSPEVAANAVASLGRLGSRLGIAVGADLCKAVQHRWAAVRANALGALRVVGARCPGRPSRAMLERDRSVAVRRAAAALLRDVGTEPQDERALRRCALREPRGSVAVVCLGRSPPVTKETRHVLLFVIPAGESRPFPRAPFALERPDGLIRHGRADRRGAVWEADMPDGEIGLSVPASLSDE